MKKLFLLILFTAVLVFNQSCSEDSNPVNVDDPALVGTWELNELKIDNEVIDRETFDDDYPQKISFNDDGSFTMIIFKSDKFKRTIVGEYESKNNSITFKVPSESADFGDWYDYYLDNSILSIRKFWGELYLEFIKSS